MNIIPMAIVCIGAVASTVVSSPLIAGKFQAQPSALTSPDGDTIIGGYNASIKDFPYQVSIYEKGRKGVEQFACAGSIISQYHILTAAQCLSDTTNDELHAKKPADLVIRVGSTYRNNGTIIPIAQVFVHPKFNFKTLDADVGVMKAVSPIQFTDVIQPTKLPPKNKPLIDDSIFVVSGWGLTNIIDEDGPLNLMALKIPVANHDKCNKIYKGAVTKNMWCGGYLDVDGKGTCYGDSGSPAVQDGTLVGIVSWGPMECGEKGYPGGYTYVAAPDVRDFITNHTGI